MEPTTIEGLKERNAYLTDTVKELEEAYERDQRNKMKTRIEEAAEKWWYKPLHDSMNSDGTFDKDMFRYKDLGKQSGIQGFIAGAEFMQKENEELKYYKEQWQEIAGKANLKHLVSEAEKLKAQLEKAENIIKAQLDFEAKSIAKHGEYVGEEINELIKKAREYFKGKEELK